MSCTKMTRRGFMNGMALATAGTMLAACVQRVAEEAVITEVQTDAPAPPTPVVEPSPTAPTRAIAGQPDGHPVVSIAGIESNDVAGAVVKAIDLLGGIEMVMAGKSSILLKPNLHSDHHWTTTNPKVVQALAALMRTAGKEVLIGEGSALAPEFTMTGSTVHFATGKTWRVKERGALDAMQKYVFDYAKYTPFAKEMGIPLVNLHTGDLVQVDVPGGLVYDRITLNRSLAEVDMVCSVPCMRVHNLTGVSLGMKNMMGAYPGSVYYTPRCLVHERCATLDDSGTHPAIVDIVRATKPGLTIVDGFFGWEFNETHPWADSCKREADWGFVGACAKRVPLNLIIAGTNPLATDMVAASVMGYEPHELGTFEWAWKAGMEPKGFDEIEIRGETLGSVSRKFVRYPKIFSYSELRELRGWQSFLEHTEKW